MYRHINIYDIIVGQIAINRGCNSYEEINSEELRIITNQSRIDYRN